MATKEQGSKTMNIPPKTSVQLSKLVVRMRSKGFEVYKNGLVEAMVAHFDRNPEQLVELLKV